MTADRRANEDESDHPIGTATDRQERFVEIASAILLGLATLLTAASAFQAALFRTDANRRYEQSQQAGVVAAEDIELAGQQDALDTEIWAQLEIADATGDDAAARILREEVLRPEAVRAVDTWKTLEPRPPTPFTSENPGYSNEFRAAGKEKSREARADFEAARDAAAKADRATLTSVIFAAVLFIAGIANTFKIYRPRLVALGVAIVLLLVGGWTMAFGV